MSKEPKHQATSHVEQGWQAWKATNPRVEWFPDLPNPYLEPTNNQTKETNE